MAQSFETTIKTLKMLREDNANLHTQAVNNATEFRRKADNCDENANAYKERVDELDGAIALLEGAFDPKETE